MTSKISYIKLIREDIRHRGWLAALTGIVLFLGMPVHAMLCIDSYLGGNDPNRRAYWTEYIQDMMPTMVNGYDITFVAYAIILLGALGALGEGEGDLLEGADDTQLQGLAHIGPALFVHRAGHRDGFIGRFAEHILYGRGLRLRSRFLFTVRAQEFGGSPA